jgi:hypothetical protein
LKEREPEFLNRIAKHKGILYKVSKMYMDNHDTTGFVSGDCLSTMEIV